ncbi:hypothetical protein MPOCJGCO_4133 [Methylobacterium trifolii]|uniref:Copper chaperone PCu(A)C n=1 Tax=Methylobacterium trifolii TaxID=1003092 RepID=A0ABQ4U3K9_9HYPH|nr:hypothetical protein MPOCJGCO_4133 [Methylobacterium trifolii]
MNRILPAGLGLLLAAMIPALAQERTGPLKAGDLAIEAPWMRAVPAGAKVAGGYVRITNTGSVPDRLTAAAVGVAGRGEIHSMTMEGGVMKMAPVPGGLSIEPGKTVELKPGGFHLMFQDLRSAPKPGDGVPGSLTFERAGTVPVTFAVASIGAMSPQGAPPATAGAHQHH